MNEPTTAGNRAPSLTIVIPAFNEALVLPGTLRQLTAFLPSLPFDWDILVVDDGSTDATAALAAEAARIEPRIAMMVEPHRGKGGAVKAGMLAARGDYRFLCDADLSMPLRELPRFFPPAQAGADIVIASREDPGARRVGEPWWRRLSGRVFNRIIRWLVLDGLPDTQCGFKLFTAEAARAIFPTLTLDGWAFDVEALVLARRLGLVLAILPIEWHYRHGTRIALLRDAWAMFRDILAVRRRFR
jgi:dolichyl-phosphate beta-glucosyltransferase